MGGSDRKRRLTIKAWSPWAVGRDEGQIVVRVDGERLGQLTLWLRTWGAGYRNGHGTDGESPDDKEGESIFEEHDDTECPEEEQTTTAPGLKFGR